MLVLLLASHVTVHALLPTVVIDALRAELDWQQRQHQRVEEKNMAPVTPMTTEDMPSTATPKPSPPPEMPGDAPGTPGPVTPKPKPESPSR